MKKFLASAGIVAAAVLSLAGCSTTTPDKPAEVKGSGILGFSVEYVNVTDNLTIKCLFQNKSSRDRGMDCLWENFPEHADVAKNLREGSNPLPVGYSLEYVKVGDDTVTCLRNGQHAISCDWHNIAGI